MTLTTIKPRSAVLISLALGALMWIIDALADTIFFYHTSFIENLLLTIPPHDIFVRSIMIVIAVFSGILCWFLLRKNTRQNDAHKKLILSYRLLDECTNALLNTDEEINLLNRVCTIISESGVYRMAWVGFAMNDENLSVKPVAARGVIDGFFDDLVISWSENEHGRSPTGTAIRTGKPAIVNDIGKENNDTPWGTAAIARNYHSSIALPIRIENSVIGALNIFSSGPNAFSAEEAAILGRLAGNISLGVQSVRFKKQYMTDLDRLQHSEKRLKTVIDTSPRAIIVIDRNNIVTLWNPAAEKLFGWSSRSVTGTQLPIYNNGLTEDIFSILKYLWEGLSIEEIETSGVTREGITIDIRISAAPLLAPDGTIDSVLLIIADITEQKTLQTTIKEREALLNGIFRATPAGIGLVKNRILGWCNSFMKNLTGYTPEELEGKSARLLYPDDDEFEKVARVKHPLVEKYGVGTMETRWVRKDGTVIDILLSSSSLVPGDLSAGLVYTALDISELKKYNALINHQKQELESAVRDLQITNVKLEEINLELARSHEELKALNRQYQESEKRYRLLAENSIDVIWTMTLDGRFTYVSPSVTALAGFTPEEVLSMGLEQYITPESYSFVIEQIALELNKPVDERSISFKADLVQYTRERGPIDIEISCAFINDQNGNPVGIQGSTRDIGERKRAEEKIRASEEKFSRAFHTSPDSININRTSDGTYININDGFTKLTGYTSEEVIGKTSLEINIWADTADRQRLVEQLTRTGEVNNLEARFRLKNGSVKTGLMSARVITINNEQCILSITRDITEQKLAQAIINSERDRAQMYFETAGVMLITIDPMGRISMINQKGCEILGCERNDIIGKDWIDHFIPQRQRKKVNSVFKKIITGEYTPIEYFENPIVNSRGEERLMAWHNKVITHEAGVIIGVLSSGEDITERRAAEEKLKKSLREKELLLREIHHRVKNNLGIIYSILHFQKNIKSDQPVNYVLANTQNRVKSMALIHQNLYASEDLDRIDFSVYCHELLKELIKTMKPPGIRISTKIDVDTVNLNIDTVLPCGLIINELVNNSLTHGFKNRDTGTIKVEFHCGEDNRCVLSVTDNGQGLPEGMSLQEAKSLGMFIINSLTKQLGGKIEIESDKGLSISIFFDVN